MTQKQKLTLYVGKDVVERAKAEGINISEITEKLLTAITLTSKKEEKDILRAFKVYEIAAQKLKEVVKNG